MSLTLCVYLALVLVICNAQFGGDEPVQIPAGEPIWINGVPISPNRGNGQPAAMLVEDPSKFASTTGGSTDPSSTPESTAEGEGESEGETSEEPETTEESETTPESTPESTPETTPESTTEEPTTTPVSTT